MSELSKRAVEDFKLLLDVAQTFGGEEVIDISAYSSQASDLNFEHNFAYLRV